MLTINLLPKEQQKRKKVALDISFLPIVAGIIGAVITLHLLFGLVISFKAGALSRLERRWQSIMPDKNEADALIAELGLMRARIDAIDKLVAERLSWAKKLSDLSNAMTTGVWLNRIWIEKRAAKAQAAPVKVLHLSGSVIAGNGQETSTIGKFMQSLRDNQGFFSDFRDIESVYVQQNRFKDVEVMDFEFICYFKR